MTLQVLVAHALGAGLTVLTILSQVALWQRKEYRFDRLWTQLKSRSAWPEEYWLLAGAYALMASSWLILIFDYDWQANITGWTSLLAILFYHGRRLYSQGLWRPVVTGKAALVLVETAAGAILFTYIILLPNVPISLIWATEIFFTLGIVALAVGAANVISIFPKMQILGRAGRLRASLPNIACVGITGSWGKTSVKFFLEQILAGSGKNFAVSAEHRNSELAVAQDMISNLRSGPDIYVAEMGAYKKGEIAALARLVRPRIGVITAVGSQHLSLFGSLDNILSAKWEMAESLPDDGTLILNADDTRLTDKAKQFKGNIIWFSMSKQADVWAEGITFKETLSEFTLHILGIQRGVVLPIISRGLIASLLAAVAAATELGVDADRVFDSLKSLKTFPRTMEPRAGKGHSRVIDDSYSASEASFKNALEYLKNNSATDKRIVMVPMIELEPMAKEAHRNLGALLAQSGAKVHVYGRSYRKQLSAGGGKIITYTNPKKMAQEVPKGLSQSSLVLLEGRVPDVVRKAILA